jgi:hypothetical protein
VRRFCYFVAADAKVLPDSRFEKRRTSEIHPLIGLDVDACSDMRKGKPRRLGSCVLWCRCLKQLSLSLRKPETLWGMETCQFPQQTRIKLEQFQSRGLGFARIFDFYKCIGAFSAARPPAGWHHASALLARRGPAGQPRYYWGMAVDRSSRQSIPVR